MHTTQVRATVAIVGAIAIITTAAPAMAIAPPPTVNIRSGDNWVNQTEQSALLVDGLYRPTDGSVQHVRATVSVAVDAACSVVGTAGVDYLVPVNIPVDGVSGTWSHTFNVSSLPEGPLCARAVSYDGTYSPIGFSSTQPIKDTLPPVPGTAEILDGDGYINGGEAATGVPARWSSNGDADGALVWFEDAGGTIPSAACGTYQTPSDDAGVGAGGAGAFNAACAAAMPEGTVTMKVQWWDDADNFSTVVIDSTTLDTIPPFGGSVTLVDPNNDGFLNAAEAAAGSVDANWHNPNPDAIEAHLLFRDVNRDVYSPECGPFIQPRTGFGWVNTACANSMAQGRFEWAGNWYDAAGNKAGEAIASMILDTIAPPLTLTSPLPGDVLPTTFTLKGNGERFMTLEIQLDALPPTTMTTGGASSFEKTFTGLTDGPHTVTVTATDAAKNESSISVSFTVDSLIPLITHPVQGDVVPRLFEFLGTCRPDTLVQIFHGSTIMSESSCSSQGNFEDLVGALSGKYTVRARAVQGGTVSPFGPERTFFVDPGPPQVTITTPDLAINPLQIRGSAEDLVGVDHIQIEYFDELRGVKLVSALADCFFCGRGETAIEWIHRVPSQLTPDLVRVQVYAVNDAGSRSRIESIRFLYTHDF